MQKKIYDLLENIELGYGDRTPEQSENWTMLSQWLVEKTNEETGELKLSGEETACVLQQIIAFEGLTISIGHLQSYEDFEEIIEPGVCNSCESGIENPEEMNEARRHAYMSLGVAEMFMFGPNRKRKKERKKGK